jgi:hypothetical protein
MQAVFWMKGRLISEKAKNTANCNMFIYQGGCPERCHRPQAANPRLHQK